MRQYPHYGTRAIKYCALPGVVQNSARAAALEEKDVSTPRNYQESIEQLHQEVEALAEEMRRLAPTIIRVTLLPFSIGAAFALTMFAVIAFAVKHV